MDKKHHFLQKQIRITNSQNKTILFYQRYMCELWSVILHRDNHMIVRKNFPVGGQLDVVLDD